MRFLDPVLVAMLSIIGVSILFKVCLDTSFWLTQALVVSAPLKLSRLFSKLRC